MDVQPVPNLSYNLVAFAKRDKKDVILKIGMPNPELNSEMAALKLFNGDGACQLLACDEERGFLLLERINPGTVLADLTDDDERTNIATDVMQKICREVPSASPAQAAVRNVVDFGAFIDIGVKQDGLLHKSQIPKGTVLKVGDIIDIEIQKIEAERGRIGLGWVK
jgi:streptomycin 6-kinase